MLVCMPRNQGVMLRSSVACSSQHTFQMRNIHSKLVLFFAGFFTRTVNA